MIFFDNWSSIGRTLIVGLLAYAGMILLLRVSGKRTLSKMNAFDLVVTVALGSSLATALLSKQTSLADGLTAFAVLIFLQFAISWLSVRVRWIERIVKGRPALLFYRGQFLRPEMKAERVAEDEVLAAIRGRGAARLEQVHAVILETDGSFAVILDNDTGVEASALSNVETSAQNRGSQAE